MPPVDDAPYTELRNSGVENPSHVYSELDTSNYNVPHQSQHHHDGVKDARPTVADADYTELSNIGADNAAHLYSELSNVPTRYHTYANVSP